MTALAAGPLDELRSLVGHDRVLTASDDLAPYRSDLTEQPPGDAGAVVRPAAAQQVAEVMTVAARHGLAVTPCVARFNVAGLAIPQGGLVLDLSDLTSLEIDRDTMVAVAEPGVTFAQLKAALDTEAPELVYGYPFAPPEASVVANALLDGLTSLSLPFGAMGAWLCGVEAVLADGTVVRTGSGGVVDAWFGRAPLPDLTGLFISTQGTTGVVTKAALALQPAPAARVRWFAFADDLDQVYPAMRALARSRSVDDVGCMTWPAAKMLFGAYEGLTREASEPLAFLFIDLTGSTEAELKAREDMARAALAEAGITSIFSVDRLVKLLPGMAKLAELPTTLDFLLDHPGGGLTWVGSYGPGRTWLDGARAGLAALEAHGFPPFLVARPMAGGHYYVLRFVACFDKADPADVERVRAVMGELAEIVLDHDYVPYKPSADAVARMTKRAHPGAIHLLDAVRSALDPDRRMNPGRLLS